MKKFILSIATITIALHSWAQTLNRSIRPKPGPTPEIKIGEPQTFTLPNGLRVFVVEDHKLPVVSCSIQFDIRPELEKDQAGYAELMSELLLTGTKTRSKDKLSSEIDFIGATLIASSEGFYASSLKKHMEKTLDLLSDIAINADMKKDELDKLIRRQMSGLEAEKTDPDAMLQNVSAVLNYGTDFPYGEVTTEKTIKNVNLAVCQKYYNTYFRPNVAYMAVVGDITVQEIKPLLEKYFGGWQKADVPVATYSQPAPPTGRRVAFVPRDGSVQSVINVTYPVVLKPGTDDVIKAEVATTILGGSSQGRLFKDLREKHAWTYGSYASIRPDELIGSFTAFSKCRNAVTDSALDELLVDMKTIQMEKVTPEELQECINYLSGGFALGLQNKRTVAQFAINTERFHMPKDYYKNYLKNLSAVTIDDVSAMAHKYINPDNANVVIVGSMDEAGLMPSFASNNSMFGYYDNYGNKLKTKTLTPAPDAVTGDSVLRKYINAIGGEKIISGIKDIKIVYNSTYQGIPITITELRKAPDKYMQKIDGVQGGQFFTLQKEVLNGTKGRKEGQGGKADMTADEIADAKREGDIYINLHPQQYNIKRDIKGIDTLNNLPVYVVNAVDDKAKTTVEYYDIRSGLLMKTIKMQETPQGIVPHVEEYSNYKMVNSYKGYKMPYTITSTDPGMVLKEDLDVIEINNGISDSKFE